MQQSTARTSILARGAPLSSKSLPVMTAVCGARSKPAISQRVFMRSPQLSAVEECRKRSDLRRCQSEVRHTPVDRIRPGKDVPHLFFRDTLSIQIELGILENSR